MSKRDYQAYLEAQLRVWDKCFDTLRKKAGASTNKIDGRLDEWFQRLLKRRLEVQVYVENLSLRGDQTWRDLKNDIDFVWNDLREDLARLAERIE